MNKVTMASTEYQTLSDKIDRLSEKIGEQFTRIEDNKLSRSEYEHAHESLVSRVNSLEQRMDSEIKTGDAVHEKLETSSQVRYDKTDAKIDLINTKVDTLKDSMNQRFDNLRDTAAAARRGWVQWSVGLGLGLLGGGGVGSLIWYLLAHAAHP